MVYSTVPVDDSQIGDKTYNLLDNKVTEFFALFCWVKSIMHLVVKFRCLSSGYKCPLVNKIIAHLYSVAQQLGEDLSSKPVSDPCGMVSEVDCYFWCHYPCALKAFMCASKSFFEFVNHATKPCCSCGCASGSWNCFPKSACVDVCMYACMYVCIFVCLSALPMQTIKL